MTQTMEIRANDIHVRANRDDSHLIEGVAIVYQKLSEFMGFYEYVMPSALDGVDLSQLLLLYSHDYSNVLASVPSKTLEISNQKDGLHFKAQLPNTSLGNDVAELISTKRVSGMSFGFKIASGGDSWSKQGDKVIHTVSRIQSMSEISITPIPAYQETKVSTQVKRSLEEFKKKGAVRQNMAEDSNSADLLVSLLEKVIDKLGDSKPDTKKKPSDDKKAEDEETSTSESDQADGQEDTVEDSESEDPEDERAKKGKQTQSGVTTQPVDNSAPKANSGETTQPVPGTKKQKRDDEVPDDEPIPEDNSGDGESEVAPDDADISEEPDEDAKKIKENKRDHKPAEEKREVANNMAKDITPQANVEDEQKRDFEEYLKNGEAKRDATDGGIKLEDGSVLIPSDILTPEKEKYQFPRLGTLVRTVNVKHTTGKLPVFYPGGETLTEHAEYAQSDRHKIPEVKPINWDLKTRTGSYVYSQDLLSDSDYNWESELADRLKELRDNTNDAQIMGALTRGVAKATLKDDHDIIKQVKTALDTKLQPNDAREASVVMSQSAFSAIDLDEDNEARPLLQPDLTQGTGQRFLGKQLIIVPDELFPSAKAGDKNIIVAPLKKAVINFKNNEITGKFMDSYDVWYKILGIYMRQDVVQARKDLIVYIGNGTTGEDSGK